MSLHVYHCPLRWGDMDAQGHVNNVAWVDHLQEARIDYLLSGPLAPMLDDGVVVVSHQIEYLAPTVADDEPLRIELWVDQVGAARFSIGYHLSHHDRAVGRARTVVTGYDLDTGRIRRLTEAERHHLVADLDPHEPLRTLARGELVDPAEVELVVRWSDLDAYGHVNNVEFFEYVQQARIAFLSKDFSSEDGMWVVVRQDMDYRRPMPYRREPYAVRIGVVAQGRTSVTVAAEIVDPQQGTVFARADTVLVCTDREGRPRPVSQATVNQGPVSR